MSTTVGLELEWADVDRWKTIPENMGKWSTEDYSIVNSDGHANCPTGSSWRWGGEINTRPTMTSVEQAHIVRELAKLLNPTINYKCNLHVHVRHEYFAEMIEDVEWLKRVAVYLRGQEEFVYSHIEYLEPPTQYDFPDPEELRGAKKRYRRNLNSHQHTLNPDRWVELLNAKTPQEFKDAHASPTWDGKRAWHIAKRPGMNMRSLWKHGTIEFRHFPGTADPDEAESAARWCQLIVENAMKFLDCDFLKADEIFVKYGPWKFPEFRPYDHKLQLGFESTKFK